MTFKNIESMESPLGLTWSDFHEKDISCCFHFRIGIS